MSHLNETEEASGLERKFSGALIASSPCLEENQEPYLGKTVIGDGCRENPVEDADYEVFNDDYKSNAE